MLQLNRGQYLSVILNNINLGVMQEAIKTQTPRGFYWLGLICLVPLLGAILGLALLIMGLVRYKDKWLAIIGGAGILWTVLLYGTLFYALRHASIFRNGFEDISQMQLNRLIKDVEFYKLSHGDYPDNLKQLQDEDKLTPINDPVQGLSGGGQAYYNYEKLGDHYLLFSSGKDGVPNTRDDLFPQVAITENSHIGWLRSKYPSK